MTSLRRLSTTQMASVQGGFLGALLRFMLSPSRCSTTFQYAGGTGLIGYEQA